MNTKRKSKRAALVICIHAPGECSEKDLQSFARLVRQGEQVTSVGLEDRIASAAWLGFAWLDEKLAGVAAVKNPRPSYRKKVFSAAQAAMLVDRFPREYGWSVVLPDYGGRGIAKTLLHELLTKTVGDGIFATTSVVNKRMQRILQHSGFEVVGKPFPSPRKDSTICLWVHSGS